MENGGVNIDYTKHYVGDKNGVYIPYAALIERGFDVEDANYKDIEASHKRQCCLLCKIGNMIDAECTVYEEHGYVGYDDVFKYAIRVTVSDEVSPLLERMMDRRFNNLDYDPKKLHTQGTLDDDCNQGFCEGVRI